MNKTNPPISDKKTIRIMVQEKIAHMSIGEKERESNNVCNQLIQIFSHKNFSTIITYNPFDDEINISPITLWGKETGKHVLTIPQNNDPFEIPENSILIVPGRAFTKKGKRIGRGSGYYDRLINAYTNMYTIGVCFDCQIYPNLPEERWDKRVNEVVFAGNILE